MANNPESGTQRERLGSELIPERSARKDLTEKSIDDPAAPGPLINAEVRDFSASQLNGGRPRKSYPMVGKSLNLTSITG